MIPALCINDNLRPNEIPLSEWVKKGEQYRITDVARLLPQNVLGYSIYEKPLGPHCQPYEYFLSTRFSVAKEDIPAIVELFLQQNPNTEDLMDELLENSGLQLA